MLRLRAMPLGSAHRDATVHLAIGDFALSKHAGLAAASVAIRGVLVIVLEPHRDQVALLNATDNRLRREEQKTEMRELEFQCGGGQERESARHQRFPRLCSKVCTTFPYVNDNRNMLSALSIKGRDGRGGCRPQELHQERDQSSQSLPLSTRRIQRMQA
eukprot:5312037-Pleurochrysis_carterae.AAC.2